jgi:hypothetical protein
MADSVPITLPFKQKDLARRTVLAAFVAPLMLPKVRDTLQVLSQDVRPPQSPTVLPFVKDTDKAARGCRPPLFLVGHSDGSFRHGLRGGCEVWCFGAGLYGYEPHALSFPVVRH